MNKKNSRVIINADDFGITKGVNAAITELAGAGVVSSASVMSNMEHYTEAEGLREKIGLGLHFNLTVGRPACPHAVPSLVGNDGNFNALGTLLKKMSRGDICIKDVEAEFSAQARRLLDIGIAPDHLNSHESILKYPFFRKAVTGLVKKYNIGAVRTYTQKEFQYSRLLNPMKILKTCYLELDKFLWRAGNFKVAGRCFSLLEPGMDPQSALAKLAGVFQDLPSGVLEIMVHPGYLDGNDGPLGGYLTERESEAKALLSREFIGIIKNSRADLIAFRDI